MKYIFGYPLFIRLVIHLSVQWQLNLVQLLQTIFGNKLYQPTLDRIDWINNKRLPSPRDFLTKIIIVVVIISLTYLSICLIPINY